MADENFNEEKLKQALDEPLFIQSKSLSPNK